MKRELAQGRPSSPPALLKTVSDGNGGSHFLSRSLPSFSHLFPWGYLRWAQSSYPRNARKLRLISALRPGYSAPPEKDLSFSGSWEEVQTTRTSVPLSFHTVTTQLCPMIRCPDSYKMKRQNVLSCQPLPRSVSVSDFALSTKNCLKGIQSLKTRVWNNASSFCSGPFKFRSIVHAQLLIASILLSRVAQFAWQLL